MSYRYLTPPMLEHLARYKYVSAGYTWLDCQLTPFWNWLVELLPMWMAPNMVTFIGFVGITAMTGVVCFAAPALVGSESSVFSSVFAIHAAALFVYQHMDAVDGKQARRTGASSPLGQLFDHGCDCFVNVICALSTSACLDFGASFRLALLALSNLTPFFVAQWAEYHLGSCSTSNGYVGVTEGLVLLIGIELHAAWVGPVWWAEPLSLGPVAIAPRDVVLAFVVASNAIMNAGLLWSVLAPRRAGAPELGGDMRGDKAIGKFNAVAQLVPMMAWVALSAQWLYRLPARSWTELALSPLSITSRPSAFFAHHTVLCAALSGFQFALVTTRMIVAHMCKTSFSPVANCFVLAPLALVTAVARWPEVGAIFANVCSERSLTLALCALSLALYLHYVIIVVQQICGHLGIYCFSLQYMKANKKAN